MTTELDPVNTEQETPKVEEEVKEKMPSPPKITNPEGDKDEASNPKCT